MMVNLEDEQALLSKTLNDVFERLLDKEHGSEQTIFDLETRVSRIDELEAENIRLRKELEVTISRSDSRDPSNLNGVQQGSRASIVHPEFEKKYNKVLLECEYLKSVNNELYTRLHQAQAKLREWNRFSSPRLQDRSETGTRSPALSGTPSHAPSRDMQRESSPDLPPMLLNAVQVPPSRHHGPSQVLDASQSHLDSRPDLPVLSNVIDLASSETSEGSQDETQPKDRPDLKRKHADVDERPSITVKSPTVPGQVDDCMIESSSSEIMDLNDARDVNSSQTEDLSRSLRPPTPKRRKDRPALLEEGNSKMVSVEDTMDSPVKSFGGSPSANDQRGQHISKMQSLVRTRTPLRQIDGNTKSLPRTSELKKSGRRRDRPVSEAVNLLAEGGGEMASRRSTSGPSREIETSALGSPAGHVSAHRRLPQLLAGQSTNKELLCRPSAASASLLQDGSRKPQASRFTLEELTPAQRESLNDLAGEYRYKLRTASWFVTQSGNKKIKALSDVRNVDIDWFEKVTTLLKELHCDVPERSPQEVLGLKSSPGLHTSEISDGNKTPRAPPLPSAKSAPSGSTPKASMLRPRTAGIGAKSHDVGPDDEPLRARPLRRLNLSDFKINPAQNAGLTYAYSDVVRNQALRKCLPGCTRPECCGTKFSALASDLPTANLVPTRTTGTASTSLSPDDTLLLTYLGPLSAPAELTHLTSTERSALLQRAKTKAAADKYGKMHRHAWQPQRPRSPPGFWRTDMPGSQEEEQDRREAERIVRDMVEERWREAMRGGRWQFRDE